MGDKPNFRVVESHNVDLFDRFVELYREGYKVKDIRKKLDIGGWAYNKYLKLYKEKFGEGIKGVCAECGAEFVKHHPLVKYCSDDCRYNSLRKRWRKKNKKKRRRR